MNTAVWPQTGAAGGDVELNAEVPRAMARQVEDSRETLRQGSAGAGCAGAGCLWSDRVDTSRMRSCWAWLSALRDHARMYTSTRTGSGCIKETNSRLREEGQTENSSVGQRTPSVSLTQLLKKSCTNA